MAGGKTNPENDAAFERVLAEAVVRISQPMLLICRFSVPATTERKQQFLPDTQHSPSGEW